MQKKIVLIVFIICSIGILILLFLYFSKDRQVVQSPVFKAIPLNTVLVYEIKNIGDFINLEDKDNKIFKELINIPSVAELNNTIRFIDSLFVASGKMQSIYEKNLFITNNLLGQKQSEYLFLIPIDLQNEKALYENFILSSLGEKAEVKRKEYEKETIYEIALYDSKYSSFYFSFIDGVLLLSFSSVIIETSIRQIASDVSLLQDEAFSRVNSTAGENIEVNVYVNMKLLPTFFSSITNKETAKFLKSIKSLGAWAEFDANIKSGSLLLNGYAAIQGDKDYLKIFINQSPVSLEIAEVLPATTATFWAIGIDNPETFRSDYEMYLRNNLLYDTYLSDLKKLSTHLQSEGSADVAINDVLFDILDKEMAMVFANVSTLKTNENTYAVMKVKSQGIAKEKLVNIINLYCEKSKLSFETFVSEFKLSEDVAYKIYKMPVLNIPYYVFGSFFKNARAEYFALVDDYLVFANTEKSLTQFIHDYELKRTLVHDENFNDFTSNLSSSSNFYFYSDCAKSFGIYESFLNEDMQAALDQNRNTFQKFQAVAYQFSSSNGMLYSNVYLNYNPIVEDKPHTVWESYLDTSINFKPKLVVNHVTKEKDIFVQDEANTIYLLNKTGRILWKKEIKEKINSQIFHVDFYKNKKFQLVFSTKNYIYVVDRIGNFVEHYPLKLESESTAGISVFDYDNNRDYRMLIPCANKKVYLFDISGKIISGWAAPSTESVVVESIQHFKVNDKDYIVYADDMNTYILNRRGEQRIKVKERFEKSVNNFFIYNSKSAKNEDRIVTTDKNGTVKYIYFDGKVETFEIKKFPEYHHFELRDFNSDGVSDFVFVYDKKMEVYDINRKMMFDVKFKNNITARPVFYDFSATDLKTGIVDNVDELIYLINKDGSFYEGFPLKGRTLFSVGNLFDSKSNFNLIVGGNNNYIYNYEVK
ncbi:MAG: DUF3352 domain-containing protein [Bacteroidales bacterium]|nr:DUF3352 domain-containing protein [Bacteroidales bacterium]